MQDGQFAIPQNTPFEDKLNEAGIGVPDSPAVRKFNQTDQPTIDPETLLYNFQNKINSKSESPTSPSTINPVSPFQIDTSGRYDFQRIGADNEDLYGQGQTAWEKAANGFLKGVNLAGTTFIQGTLGLIYGVATAIGKGEFNALYNNEFSNAIQRWNDSMENILPNYYTAKERARDWWEPGNIFSANFLWDKLVKNLGFSVGAIYSGAAVTRALKLVPELFNLSLTKNAIQAANKAEQAMSVAPNIDKLSTFQSVLRSASANVTNTAKIIGPSERFLVSTLGAVTEGGIEALQGMNEYRNSLVQDYTAQYGYAPTGEHLNKINDYAAQLGNARFGLNMALLTATNYVQLPKILGSSYKTSKLIANGIERELNPVVKDVTTGLLKQALPTSRAGKLFYKSGNIANLILSPTEGFEEGSQYAVQLGVQDYYNKKYKGEGANFLNSIAKGYYDTLNSNEGMEQIFIGALSGGLQQSGIVSTKGFLKSGKIKERGFTGYEGRRAADTTSFLQQVNNSKLIFKSDKWLSELADAAARGINLQLEGEALIHQGDVLESKDNEFDYQHNYLTPRIKYGRFDLVKDDIDSYRSLASTLEGFQTLQKNGIANENDTIQTFLQRLSNFEAHAENVNSLYQSLNIRYGGIVDKTTDEKLYPEETIDKMVYAASKIANYDQRIPQVTSSLTAKGVAVQTVLDEILSNNIHASVATKEAIDQINNLDILSDEKDQLKSDLRDTIELALRRKYFLKEYDSIKSNPEKYVETPIVREGSAPIPQVDKTPSGRKKTVTKDVLLNKEYSLKEPILRDGNTLTVAPKITILSSTLGGEYEVKLPDGTITFIPQSELKDYNISDSPINDNAVALSVSNAVSNLINKNKKFQKYQDEYGKINLTDPDPITAITNFVNSKDDKELVDAIEKEIKNVVKQAEAKRKKELEEQEKIQKDEALKKELQEYRDNANNKADILVGDELSPEQLAELASREAYEKAPLLNFLSKEADYYDRKNPKPHQQRRLSFLTRLARTQGSQEAAKIRVIAITKNNEKHYGLQGLTAWVKKDISTSLTDPAQREKYLNKDGTVKDIHEPIVKLYVIKEKDGLYLSNANGDKLSPLGKATEKTLSPQKEDIEKRRQKELDNRTKTKEEKGQWIKTSEKTDKGVENVSIIGQKHHDGNKVIIQIAMPTADGYETGDYFVYVQQFTPLQFTDGKMSSAPDVVTMPFKDKAEADRYINDRKKGVEKAKIKLASQINAKYDAELAALGQQSVDASEQVINEGIFSVFHSTLSGVYEFGPHEGEPNYSKGSEADLKKAQAQFDEWRKKTLSLTKSSPEYSIAGISKGIVLRDDVNKPVTTTALVTDDELDNEGLITIPTLEGQIVINNQSFNFPVGQPLLTNGSNIDFLNNRQFTRKEAEEITDLIEEYTSLVYNKKKAEASRLQNYLSSILYLRSPKEGETPTSNAQIYFSNDGGLVWNFHFGTSLTIPFTPITIKNAREQIVNYFSSYYIKANNKILKEAGHLGFEYAVIEFDGRVGYHNASSYQRFLLENNSAFSTPVLRTRAIKSTGPLDPTVISRYTTLQSSEFNFIQEPEEQEFTEAKTNLPKGLFGKKKEDKGDKSVVDKKEDIERRRQKELNEPAGPNAKLSLIQALESANKRVAEYDARVKEELEKYGKIEPTTSNMASALTISRNQLKVKIDKINAKYDAELAALEKTTEEAPKPTGIAKGLFSGKKASKEEIEEIHKRAKAEIEKAKQRARNRPFDTGEFKLALSPILSYNPIDIEKELSYIYEKTNFYPVILHELLKTPQGIYAWGSYKDMVIKLSTAAQAGTGYHEVFEGVFKTFLSQKEKDNILKEFRQRKGTFTYFDGTTHHSIPHSEATEERMKETLADEFAEFVQTGTKPTQSAISRFFTNLWNFIKSILTGRVQYIDQLFAKIDAGDYKSPAYNSFSPSESEEYKLADLDYSQQYEIIRGVAIQVIQEVINPNKADSISLTEFEESNKSIKKFYDDVYKRLESIYTVGIYKDEMGLNDNPQLQEAYARVWENISNDWQRIKELTNEYLKTFGIVESIREDEVDVPRMEGENYNNRDYVDDSKYFRNDHKNTASRSIRLLLATLPETIATASGIQSKRTAATFMQQQVQYAKTFNNLIAQLVDINSYEDKMAKLEELGESNPNFKRLYQRLTTPSNPANPNSVLNDWKLKIRFFQTMSKQNPTAYTQYNNNDGSSITGTSNLENSKKIIAQGWIDNLKTLALSNKSKLATTNTNGDLILNTRELNGNISTIEGKLEFLNSLGIPFTRQMFDGLSQENKDKFNQGTIGLSHQIRRKDIYPLDDIRGLNSVKNFQQLAEAFISTGSDFESVFLNIDGEWQAQFISTNKISRDVNDINQFQTKRELFKALPHLEQIPDSVYLNNILFNDKGERKSLKFDIGYIQGTIDQKGKPIPGAKLTEYQRLNQEINQNLNGRYYVLVPADSKTQWLLSMDNIVSFKNVATNSNDYLNRTLDLFTAYYNTEKDSYNKRLSDSQSDLEKRQGIFKELSNNYKMDDSQFREAFQEFLQFQANEQFKFLQKFHVITPTKGGNYTWKGLDADFTIREGLSHKKLSAEDIKNILFFRTINYAINNTEIQKIFYGDILSYKDIKRYKLFLSPREISFTGSKDFNNFLNKEFNYAHETKLKDPLLGKYTYSDTYKTVTMKDVFTFNEELSKLSPAYKNTNSTDAQAYSTLPAMRARRIKATNWTEKDEQEYQYRQAVDRQFLLEDKFLNDKTYPKALQNADVLLIAKGNPNSSYIYVEKPILSGFTDINGTYQPIVDKFSIVSFSYSAIRNTNFREHYVKMLKQEIGYSIVESGRKIGSQGADSFYNEDGDVNTTPYKSVINIPFSAFGVQTDTSSKKESQTRGTQVTKLSIVNLYDNGVPTTPEAEALVKQNITLLKEQTEIGYKKLLRQIGAEDVDGEYRIVDKTKILSLVKDELLRREVADSIKQLLSINPNTKNLTTAFEALPNYTQIKNILYSYVDKNITSPKVSGGPKVQVSGALMEKYGIKRERVGNKDVYTSAGLKFYTKDEPWIEVLLPAWAARKLRKAGLEWKTDEELYSLFKSSPDANDILSGVGFRIPTQELNSMENFRIAGFLPEEMGDTVVVPEEITTKAGSDFDIDKLNSYLKNIYVDKDGKIRSIPFYGIGEEAREKLKPLVIENNFRKLFNITHKDEMDAFFVADELEYGEEQEAKDLQDNENLLDEFYKQSIENEYYRNIQSILSLPQNFERLITPNTADTLKDIRDQLINLAPEFESAGSKSIISPMYMLRVRHEGQSTLSLVGIAAVSQTRSAVAQLSEIVVDPAKIPTVPAGDRRWLGDPKKFFIALPHNESNGLPTMSSRKDVEDRYITDKNSQYINGTVDVFNDAFLSQINFNNKTAGTYLFMEDVGMPNSIEHPIVSFFMNQPIIRQFLNELDIQGKNYLLDRSTYNRIKTFFPTKKRVSSLPQDLNELTELLQTSIKKYYNGVDLTEQENAEQRFILDEFMKYTALSRSLFVFQQGSNWDTATFNDSHSVFFKEQQRTSAEFKSVFTSVNDYMANSFIDSQRQAITKSTAALQDVLTIENPITKAALNPIMRKIGDKYLSLDDKNKLARKLEESLINFLIQTKTGINNSIQHMLVDAQTALVNQLRQFKKTTDDTDNIYGNIIIKQLIPHIKGKTVGSTKNITLAVKARDVFTKNLYNDAFQQLLQHPKTQSLARSLVKLSFLQNGISASPIAFKDAIPASIYASVVNEAINYLQDEDSLKAFVESGAFYRNNWSDEDIVKTVSSDDYPATVYAPIVKYIKLLKDAGKIPQEAKPPAALWVDSWHSDGKESFLLHLQYDDADPTQTNPPLRRLFQRVEDVDGFPIEREIEQEVDGQLIKSKKFLFVQTPALGDSYRALEYYDTVQNSVLMNGIMKPTIINFQELAQYIEDGTVDITPTQELPEAQAAQTKEKFEWARFSKNSYEVSSQGDKRFSALYAKLKDGRTIEQAYQLDVKGYRKEGNNWKLGKGKAPLRNITKEQQWEEYKALWKTYLFENPKLLEDLREKASGKVLTDKFASTNVSQARALAEILNEVPTVIEQSSAAPSLIDQIAQLEREIADEEDAKSSNSATNPYLYIVDNLPKITPESAKKETGLNIGSDIPISFIDKKGVSVERAAEYIAHEDAPEWFSLSVQDVRDEIIDILQTGVSSYREKATQSLKLENLKTSLYTLKEKLKPSLQRGSHVMAGDKEAIILSVDGNKVKLLFLKDKTTVMRSLDNVSPTGDVSLIVLFAGKSYIITKDNILDMRGNTVRASEEVKKEIRKKAFDEFKAQLETKNCKM